MSDYPQGSFSFSGGIPSDIVLEFSVTTTHGLTPNILEVKIPLGSAKLNKDGDVTLSYGDVEITFKGCTIDRVEEDVDDRRIWNVTILDRRWRWRFGRISGRYNVRTKNGTDIKPETKKTAQDLARLCLDGLWEKDYNVDALATIEDLPEIDWAAAPPGEALFALCERYGCRPIYDWKTDAVTVVVVGDGEELDLSLPYLRNSQTFNPPEKPGKIVVLCGPSSVQWDFSLLPVGLDFNGLLLYPNDLSYTPDPPTPPPNVTYDYTSGTYLDAYWSRWAFASRGFFEIKYPYLRAYATESLLRWYRISPPEVMPGIEKIKGDDDTLDQITFRLDAQRAWLSQIVLQNEQNDRVSALADPQNTQFDEYNKEVSATPLSAWVYGRYSDESLYIGSTIGNKDFFTDLDTLNPASVFSPLIQNASTLPYDDQSTPPQLAAKVAATGFYDGGFSIDPEHGLVKFSQQVVQSMDVVDSGVTYKQADGSPVASPPAGSGTYPATLWLRTRFLVRDYATRGFIRYQRSRTLDDKNGTVQYIVRDDLVYRLSFRFKGPPNVTAFAPSFDIAYTEDNETDIIKACEFYLDQKVKEYETTTPQTVVYIGFVPMSLDGAIRQITWSVGGDGRAITTVSRDQEDLHTSRDYADRRLTERLKAMANEQQPGKGPPPADGKPGIV